ncbi:MAG: hypothetical protein AAB393_05810 [Bacteroidota bacterium]
MKNSFTSHCEAISAEVPLSGFRSLAGFWKSGTISLFGTDSRIEIASPGFRHEDGGQVVGIAMTVTLGSPTAC